MPIQRCKSNGKTGWRFGESGKCYVGVGAKAKALQQERAIRATGWVGNATSPARAPNPLRADPTRTATLRRQFMTAFRKRFASLKRAIHELVVVEDAFGLAERKPYVPIVGNAEYSSTQVNIHSKFIRRKLRDIQEKLDPLDIIELEQEPHVTVLYGLHTTDGEQVKTLLKDFGYGRLSLGRLSLFENDEFDVLKIDVHSNDLHRAHQLLKILPHTNSFPEYKPHITVAYLRPGTGRKYLDINTGLVNAMTTFGRIAFSLPSRLQTADSEQ